MVDVGEPFLYGSSRSFFLRRIFLTRYLLALHNPRTSSLTLLPNPVSPHILKRTVKALKFIAPTPAPSALEYREARTALGETFGTKKAKAAIRAQERNRVDVGAMEGVMGYVMDGIEKGAEGLMTAGAFVLPSPHYC